VRRTNTSYGRALRQSDANSISHDNGYGYTYTYGYINTPTATATPRPTPTPRSHDVYFRVEWTVAGNKSKLC
jgi:hypothetical protein